MKYYFGNALEDSINSKGWFVGNFMGKYLDDPQSLKISNLIEIKWGIHPKGVSRGIWSRQKTETTIAILIDGRMKITFPETEIILRKRGDYIIWPSGNLHKGYAEVDSIVLTIRYPSVPNDTEEVKSK